MKLLKFVLATVLKFIWSLFRKEYQLKDVLVERLDLLAKKNNIKIEAVFKDHKPPKEYILYVKVHAGQVTQTFQSFFENQVSYEKERLEHYIDRWVEVFAQNNNLEVIL